MELCLPLELKNDILEKKLVTTLFPSHDPLIGEIKVGDRIWVLGGSLGGYKENLDYFLAHTLEPLRAQKLNFNHPATVQLTVSSMIQSRDDVFPIQYFYNRSIKYRPTLC